MRTLARKRAFFGVSPDSDCLLVVGKHFASPSEYSVNRADVAALVELAAVAKDCGGRAELVGGADVAAGIGRRTEFCVGGWASNPRTGAHLRSILPGVRIEPYEGTGDEMTLQVGGTQYRRERDRVEYVLLAKVYGPQLSRPVFVLSGQTARTNLAAARFLAGGYPRLLREYGTTGRFCLVLRVVEPATYGPDFVDVAADVTAEAFAEPA
jgi:hypothetical protein